MKKILLIMSFLLIASGCSSTTNNGIKTSQDVKIEQEIVTNELEETTDVKIGEYVYLGNYLGNDLKWRVINKTNDSLMLFADCVVTEKAFDANGDYTDGIGDDYRKNKGSNFWGKSNLREWLNSNEEIVTYSHNKPTGDFLEEESGAYDTESGFLTSFSENEIDKIIPVKNKFIISKIDSKNKKFGNTMHMYGIGDPEEALSNYENAWKCEVEDKVFLLSIEEVYKYIYKNVKLNDGATYWKTSEYWLRDAFGKNGSGVRYVTNPTQVDVGILNKGNYAGTQSFDFGVDGILNNSAYYVDCGVRPAMYITSNVLAVSGDGTSTSPYRFN